MHCNLNDVFFYIWMPKLTLIQSIWPSMSNQFTINRQVPKYVHQRTQVYAPANVYGRKLVAAFALRFARLSLLRKTVLLRHLLSGNRYFHFSKLQQAI